MNDADYRVNSFLQRFKEVQKVFKTKSYREVISIKFRESCVNNHEYDEYIQYLKDSLSLNVIPISNIQRDGSFLVADENNNRVIIVEHETGLEILYIAGSVASLLSLIPILAAGWTSLKHRFSDRRYSNKNMPGDFIEVRKFNSKGKLIEQNTINLGNYLYNEVYEENKTLVKKVEQLNKRVNKCESEIKKLQQGLER